MLFNPSSRAESVQYAQPTAGQTVTVDPSTTMLIVDPAGLLATLTINFAAGAPAAGAGGRMTVMSTQAVTALTHGAGAGNSLAGALTTLAAIGFASFCYRGSTWYRCG